MNEVIKELALKWANGQLNITEALREAYEAGWNGCAEANIG